MDSQGMPGGRLQVLKEVTMGYHALHISENY